VHRGKEALISLLNLKKTSFLFQKFKMILCSLTEAAQSAPVHIPPELPCDHTDTEAYDDELQTDHVVEETDVTSTDSGILYKQCNNVLLRKTSY